MRLRALCDWLIRLGSGPEDRFGPYTPRTLGLNRRRQLLRIRRDGKVESVSYDDSSISKSIAVIAIVGVALAILFFGSRGQAKLGSASPAPSACIA